MSIDRLKVALVDNEEPVTVAQPPRRGRPLRPPEQQEGLDNATNRGIQARVRQHPQQELEDLRPTPPTYAEVTMRSGRTTRLPSRYQQ